jgi:hypothetical protein
LPESRTVRTFLLWPQTDISIWLQQPRRLARSFVLVEYVFDLDAAGNSKPFAHKVPREWLEQEKKKEAELTRIAAQAESRLDKQFRAGQAYNEADFRSWRGPEVGRRAIVWRSKCMWSE